MPAPPNTPDSTTPPEEDGDAEGGDPPPRKGGRPSKGPRKGFLLRLPPALLEELRSWANQEMRSLNGHLEYVLRDAVRRRGRSLDDEDEDEPEGTGPKDSA